MLINCFKIESFDLCLTEKAATTKNPLQLFTKKGKEISAFFGENVQNPMITPLIVAWKRLIDLFKESLVDKDAKKSVNDSQDPRLDFDPSDYLSTIVSMKQRPLFTNIEISDRVSIASYRNTIKSWVCLLAQNFDAENVLIYEKLVDLSCECLKEKSNIS
jgi:hypothetical protein